MQPSKLDLLRRLAIKHLWPNEKEPYSWLNVSRKVRVDKFVEYMDKQIKEYKEPK